MEPFAGSAGYASHHGAIERDVTLVDANPIIVRVWKWLIKATRSDIMALPAIDQIPLGGLREMDIPQEAKDLIGLSLARCAKAPANKPSRWALDHLDRGSTSYWGRPRRRGIANHVHLINHWQAVEASYVDAPAGTATWFIDPPYQPQRYQGMYSADIDDYEALARWCRSRPGQAIVCDVAGADWLPFRPLKVRGSRKRMSHAKAKIDIEHVWLSEWEKEGASQ